MRQHITQKYIDNQLICSEGRKKEEICDTLLPGFRVEVSSVSPGIGTYYLRYKINGKTKHKKIARTTDISLKDARDRARQLKLEISQGSDPQAQAKQKRSEMTFSQYFEQYYLPSVESRLRNAKGYKQQYEKYLKDAFGDIKVSQISKQMVQAFHDDLHRNKGLSKATANRYLQLIKASINWGTDMEILDLKRNPASRIKLFDEANNTRYLSSDELSRLIPILHEDDSQPAKLILFMIATGLRRSEAFNAQWKDIDLENRTLLISSTRSKGKRTESIVLGQSAIEILDSCDKSTDWPFMNIRTNRPYTTIDKSFKRFLKQAKITEKITLHGLRHTAASIMINSGRSLYDAQILLRHSSSRVTERYSHLSKKSSLAAVDTISQQLQRAASGNQ